MDCVGSSVDNSLRRFNLSLQGCLLVRCFAWKGCWEQARGAQWIQALILNDRFDDSAFHDSAFDDSAFDDSAFDAGCL